MPTGKVVTRCRFAETHLSMHTYLQCSFPNATPPKRQNHGDLAPNLRPWTSALRADWALEIVSVAMITTWPPTSQCL